MPRLNCSDVAAGYRSPASTRPAQYGSRVSVLRPATDSTSAFRTRSYNLHGLRIHLHQEVIILVPGWSCDPNELMHKEKIQFTQHYKHRASHFPFSFDTHAALSNLSYPTFPSTPQLQRNMHPNPIQSLCTPPPPTPPRRVHELRLFFPA